MRTQNSESVVPRPRAAEARPEIGAMRPARSVSSKKASQSWRAAEALFRHCRPDHLVAQLIERRLADHPSRSGHRQAIAGDAFFRASGRGATGDRSPSLQARWAESVVMTRSVGVRRCEHARRHRYASTPRAGPVAGQPHVVLGTKRASRESPPRHAGRPVRRHPRAPFRLRRSLPPRHSPSGRRRWRPVAPARDAASAQRQFEKGIAGVAGRGGAVSPLPTGPPGCPTD